MQPVTLSISLDRPAAVYLAGDTVTGRVDVHVDEPTEIRGVSVTFRGEAYLEWSESKSDGGSDDYTAHELYFSTKVYLVGGESGEVTLTPGDHTYGVQFVLPAPLPNSYEGRYGFIRYRATARVHRSWRKSALAAEAAFSVSCPLDLNMFPDAAKMAIDKESSKHFGFLWWKSGPLRMRVRVPRAGYVSGQTIPLEIHVDNASNLEVHNVRGTLNQVITWHATSKSRRTQERAVDLVFASAVEQGGAKVFKQTIDVPPLPPSHLDYCKIIDLEYIVTVTARVRGAHRDLMIEAPLLIGTSPLMDTVEYPPAYLYPSPGGPGAPQGKAGEAYPDLPPPSYEESFFKVNRIMNTKDNESTMDILSFTPRYPVWNLWSLPHPADQDQKKS
ncbi:Arrestin domain-containing protein 3 [Frankliniella fusca]|uniref:Arrestin domain-containing protein 3 n=1 Tax=Frankliniella fusca TaxID=407009 RepID=A0AAE1HJU2_9NEOP|nr:Arrestin domain-containing protein 3 [Frankliniella fusca]